MIETDLQAAWRTKQEGFAAAADMIGNLLAAWREAVHERDVLAAEVRVLEARALTIETDNAQLRAALADYGQHDSECVLSRFEQGRPTSDGGYECCYAGKWYETKPVDRTPACECGLSAALSPTPEVKP